MSHDGHCKEFISQLHGDVFLWVAHHFGSRLAADSVQVYLGQPEHIRDVHARELLNPGRRDIRNITRVAKLTFLEKWYLKSIDMYFV